MILLSLALLCVQAPAQSQTPITDRNAGPVGVTARLERAEELLRQGLADDALVQCTEPSAMSVEPRGLRGLWRASAARLTGGFWAPAARARPAGDLDSARLAYGRGVCLRSGAQSAAGSTAASRASAGGVSPVALATSALERARALAGPGRLRRDAIGNLSWLAFVQGELWRSRIPELGGAPAARASGGPGAEEVDPLDAARAAYLTAREHLVELLHLARPRLEEGHAGDRDARALVELTLRRLRELESIERQREQNQEDQRSESEESQDSEPSEGEQGESSEEQEGDPSQGQDQQEQPEDDPSEQQGDRDGEEEQEAAQKSEQVLTHEEVMRLLQTLEEIEAEGEELSERLRRMRRIPGDRDW